MSWSQQQSPDVGSDSLLSESAQLRSTLQAKTFLQALSPDDRRRLLKGTKLSGRLSGFQSTQLIQGALRNAMHGAGHRRKHHTSAVAAAAARRDELQQLLAEEKDRFIGEQAVLAQQADVSYSSRPAAHEVSIHRTPVCVHMYTCIAWHHIECCSRWHSTCIQRYVVMMILVNMSVVYCRQQHGRQQGCVCVPLPWQQRMMH